VSQRGAGAVDSLENGGAGAVKREWPLTRRRLEWRRECESRRGWDSPQATSLEVSTVRQLWLAHLLPSGPGGFVGGAERRSHTTQLSRYEIIVPRS
jgi:hypothetical protein